MQGQFDRYYYYFYFFIYIYVIFYVIYNKMLHVKLIFIHIYMLLMHVVRLIFVPKQIRRSGSELKIWVTLVIRIPFEGQQRTPYKTFQISKENMKTSRWYVRM